MTHDDLQTQVELEPDEGIAVIDSRMHALTRSTWLRIRPVEALSKQRWVRIRYSSGLFDPLTRPVLRLRTADGRLHYHFMTGALVGSAEWIGRIPKNTVEASISPTHHVGPFSFRIDQIRPIGRLQLLARALMTNPHRAYIAATKRLSNARQASWDILKSLNATTPFDGYDQWHSRFARPLDVTNFDRPRHDLNRAPEFHVFAKLEAADPSAVIRTVQSLQAQVFGRWKLFARVERDASERARELLRQAALADLRINVVDGDWPPLNNDTLVAAVAFGDRLKETALACFVEAAIDHPEWQAIYSDEDSCTGSTLHSPLLKPDWSPALNEAIDYIGRMVCLRASFAKRASIPVPEMDVSQACATLPSAAVGHIRRILYERHREKPVPTASKTRKAAQVQAGMRWPGVGIILPTRDRPDLLEPCLEGLRHGTDYPDFEVIVVDNGTTEPRALSILTQIARDPRFRIIRDDAPFNYSRLCNAGARATEKPYLAFLNNDVVIGDRQWLKALIEICLQPQAGMVGAKLLFPNGRLQHAGVILGLAGLCGHAYFNATATERGYLGELCEAHEISAVTAACCAIAREKFLDAGGLNEVDLPIELNDIDLCLRVAARGWQNYWTPHSVLVHRQSASRGVAKRHSDLYARERAYFLSHWTAVIRDDPYFHPALSLYSARPALG